MASMRISVRKPIEMKRLIFMSCFAWVMGRCGAVVAAWSAGTPAEAAFEGSNASGLRAKSITPMRTATHDGALGTMNVSNSSSGYSAGIQQDARPYAVYFHDSGVASGKAAAPVADVELVGGPLITLRVQSILARLTALHPAAMLYTNPSWDFLTIPSPTPSVGMRLVSLLPGLRCLPASAPLILGPWSTVLVGWDVTGWCNGTGH